MRTRMKRLNWRTPRNKSLGQGMAEYIIIVALVAVAGIATWSLVGSSIGQSAAGVAAVISGEDGNTQRQAAVTAAGDAGTAAGNRKTMANYGEGNNAP